MYQRDLRLQAPAPARTPGGLLLGRCNPYGAETGGPKRVLGGMYGPASAATPGMDLPENVAQGEWLCQQQAVVRARMTCQCQHKGQVMELCSWHDETVYSGEYTAGVIRQVKKTIRQRGAFRGDPAPPVRVLPAVPVPRRVRPAAEGNRVLGI